MRFLLLIAVAFLFASCGSSEGKKDISQKTDTHSLTKDTAIAIANDTPRKVDPPVYTAPGEETVNASLHKLYGNKWHVLNDKEATWMKDAFEYFIVPKRKEFPDYPYITRGDFDGDGKADTAAVVLDSLKNYQLVALMGNNKAIVWKEDISEESALSSVPKGDVDGMVGEKTKKIRMKGDGINIEYFEKAAFVLYWDKSSFKRLQTAD